MRAWLNLEIWTQEWRSELCNRVKKEGCIKKQKIFSGTLDFWHRLERFENDAEIVLYSHNAINANQFSAQVFQ